jgi:hypothetical protein
MKFLFFFGFFFFVHSNLVLNYFEEDTYCESVHIFNLTLGCRRNFQNDIFTMCSLNCTRGKGLQLIGKGLFILLILGNYAEVNLFLNSDCSGNVLTGGMFSLDKCIVGFQPLLIVNGKETKRFLSASLRKK